MLLKRRDQRMEKERNNSQETSQRVVDSTLAIYWERFGLWVATALLGMCAWLFVEQRAEVKQLGVEIQSLKVDKVSRQELKEMEDRIYNRMDGMKGDIIFHINMLREKK